MAPGNALVFVEQGDAGNKRAAMYAALEAAVIKAGGEAREFAAPRAGQLAGWLRNLATERGVTLDRDASEELARRVGGFVTEGDVDRQRQGALAAGGAREAGASTARRRRSPSRTSGPSSRRSIPDSTWAMLDAVAERRADIAGPLLDRLLETTPLPVVIVQLHRRLRELLIAADLAAAGRRPPDIVKAIGGHPFRAQKLVEQARRWTLPELDAALEGVLELDAMIKGAVGLGEHGAPGAAGVHAVGPRAGRGRRPRPRRAPGDRRRAGRHGLGGPAARPSVGGGPGLFLHDEVALDREDAAAVAEVEQLDQLGIDVQLVAVLAQAAGDAEAQPLGPVGEPERRVEAGDDEAAAAAGAAISQARHGASPGGAGLAGRRPAPDARSGCPRADMTRRYRPRPGTPTVARGDRPWARPRLLDAQDDPGVRPVLLELVVVALRRREDVDDDAAVVDQDPVRLGRPLAADRLDAARRGGPR